MDAESSERQGIPNKDGDRRSTAGCTADQGVRCECGPFRSPHESSGRSGSSLAVLPGSDLVSYPSGIVQLRTVSPVKTVEKPSIRDRSRQGDGKAHWSRSYHPGRLAGNIRPGYGVVTVRPTIVEHAERKNKERR